MSGCVIGGYGTGRFTLDTFTNSFFTFVGIFGAVVTIDFHCIATVYDVVMVCC